MVLNQTSITTTPGDLTDGNAKFAYVLMHELGHAMRLGHVNEWGESMYPSVTDWPSENWFERDTISTNDRLGVRRPSTSPRPYVQCGGISVMEPLDIDCEPVVEVAEVEDAAVPAPYPNPFEDVINVPVQALDADGHHRQGGATRTNTCRTIATEGLPAGATSSVPRTPSSPAPTG